MSLNYNQTLSIVWPNEIYVQPKPFFTTLIISSSPFLAIILLIYIVFAALTRIFSIHRMRQKQKWAQDLKNMENYLVFVTYNKKEFIDNERTFEELVGRRNSKIMARDAMPSEQQQQKPPRVPLLQRVKHRFIFGRSSTNNLSRLHLPDETKCPIELVNDALRSGKMSISNVSKK